MKTIIATAATLLMLSAPAMAMGCCCGGGKGKAAMCSKDGMAMNHGSAKGKKGGCCEKMGGNMSRRS